MEVIEHTNFVDVCHADYGVSEVKILRDIRDELFKQNIHITDNKPKRLGNSGIGTTYRFDLKLEISEDESIKEFE